LTTANPFSLPSTKPNKSTSPPTASAPASAGSATAGSKKIALATNKLLFEWSSLDHVSPSYSTITPNSTDASRTGLDPTLPWDYFHINPVDKDAPGDYLISRHTSTIYKISGTNGTILWQLSGTNGSTSFSLGLGLNFSYQHNARMRYQNATTTILTLFDNTASGFHTQSAPFQRRPPHRHRPPHRDRDPSCSATC
jgi:hypothetical protein